MSAIKPVSAAARGMAGDIIRALPDMRSRSLSLDEVQALAVVGAVCAEMALQSLIITPSLLPVADREECLRAWAKDGLQNHLDFDFDFGGFANR